jgi:hypothetical protein
MGGFGGIGNIKNVRTIENELIKRFKNAINTELSFKENIRWEVNDRITFFDLGFFKKNELFGIIKVVKKLSINNEDYKNYIDDYINISNARLYIITDNQSFYFYDKNDSESKILELTFDEITNKINNVKSIKVDLLEIEKVINIIKTCVKNRLKDNTELIDFIENDLKMSVISFDENKNCFHFFESKRNDLQTFENKFFSLLLGTLEDTKIYRYSSLSTLFESLNKLTFRMNGIFGMNDKSETNFVDFYFKKKESKLLSDKPLDRLHHKTISSLNRRYICSGSSSIDDLTLWRLYGDDAKGVCLVFNLNPNKFNSSFLIRKVKYASENGVLNELDLIAEILNEVKNKTNFEFEFKKLKVWKHFFKPFEYSIEKEIRILVVDDGINEKINEGWMLTNNNSIINPFIDFRLNDNKSPFQLEKVIVGPKCPERITNQVQIREMISRKIEEIKSKGINSILNGIKVESSKIENYR